MRYEIERAGCTVTVLIFLFYGSWTHPSHVLLLYSAQIPSVRRTHAVCQIERCEPTCDWFFSPVNPGLSGEVDRM